jgi:signal transduction histidine kinase
MPIHVSWSHQNSPKLEGHSLTPEMLFSSSAEVRDLAIALLCGQPLRDLFRIRDAARTPALGSDSIDLQHIFAAKSVRETLLAAWKAGRALTDVEVKRLAFQAREAYFTVEISRWSENGFGEAYRTCIDLDPANPSRRAEWALTQTLGTMQSLALRGGRSTGLSRDDLIGSPPVQVLLPQFLSYWRQRAEEPVAVTEDQTDVEQTDPVDYERPYLDALYLRAFDLVQELRAELRASGHTSTGYAYGDHYIPQVGVAQPPGRGDSGPRITLESARITAGDHLESLAPPVVAPDLQAIYSIALAFKKLTQEIDERLETALHHMEEVRAQDRTNWFNLIVNLDSAQRQVLVMAEVTRFVLDTTRGKTVSPRVTELGAELCATVAETLGLSRSGAAPDLETVGVFAHDFNGLLTSLLGYTAQSRDFMVSESVQKAIVCVEQGCKRAIQQVNMLIEGGLVIGRGAQLPVHPIDLRPLLQFLCSNFKDEESQGKQLSIELGPLSPFQGAEVELWQLFRNLLRNAFQAGDPPNHVRLSVQQVGTNLVAQVSDTGKGMTPEDLDRLFNEVFSRKENGYGWGTALVAKIVRKMGGSIRKESELGRGTTITVTLPLNFPIENAA